jgi:hypothetical protein
MAVPRKLGTFNTKTLEPDLITLPEQIQEPVNNTWSLPMISNILILREDSDNGHALNEPWVLRLGSISSPPPIHLR